MNLSRRQFFTLAASGVVAAATVDIERLLWVPGQKTIFLPAEKPVFVTMQWMTKEVAKQMLASLKFVNGLPGTYHDYDLKIGSTVSARMPQRFEVRKRDSFYPQGITSAYRPVVMTDQLNVTIGMLSQDVEQARRDVKAIGTALAHKANAKRLDVFGSLYHPPGVESHTVSKDGLSVRGIEAYDISTDSMIRRFDVLGGSTRA